MLPVGQPWVSSGTAGHAGRGAGHACLNPPDSCGEAETRSRAEGTPMHELRLVAVSEDGTYAVLVVPGRGGRFSLQIDDRLRAVARGQFSRVAQYEIEVES